MSNLPLEIWDDVAGDWQKWWAVEVCEGRHGTFTVYQREDGAKMITAGRPPEGVQFLREKLN